MSGQHDDWTLDENTRRGVRAEIARAFRLFSAQLDECNNAVALRAWRTADAVAAAFEPAPAECEPHEAMCDRLAQEIADAPDAPVDPLSPAAFKGRTTPDGRPVRWVAWALDGWAGEYSTDSEPVRRRGDLFNPYPTYYMRSDLRDPARAGQTLWVGEGPDPRVPVDMSKVAPSDGAAPNTIGAQPTTEWRSVPGYSDMVRAVEEDAKQPASALQGPPNAAGVEPMTLATAWLRGCQGLADTLLLQHDALVKAEKRAEAEHAARVAAERGLGEYISRSADDWRALRERAERAERERDEAQRHLTSERHFDDSRTGELAAAQAQIRALTAARESLRDECDRRRNKVTRIERERDAFQREQIMGLAREQKLIEHLHRARKELHRARKEAERRLTLDQVVAIIAKTATPRTFTSEDLRPVPCPWQE